MKENGLDEPEVIQIVWLSVIGTVDLINARPDQVEIQALRTIKVILFLFSVSIYLFFLHKHHPK